MTVLTGSQAAYARHVGVSKQTVTDWKQRGLISFTNDGDVDFEASDEALRRHGIRQPLDADGDTDAADIEAAFARMVASGQALLSKADAERVKENYAALRSQLIYDRESGAVAATDDVVVAIASEYALVRNKLLNVGSRLAPRLAVIKSAEEIKALIDAEVVLALDELTLDEPGETDYDKLRKSIQARFQPSQ